MMIEAVISMMRYLSARKDDDLVDRMNYLYTPNMLLAFSVLISFKQFGGKPIECILPAKFPKSWENYAEQYCWSQDSYFVDPGIDVELIDARERMSLHRRLSYYQWVPFLLLLQAACFRIPCCFWDMVNAASGVKINEIVEKACDHDNVEAEKHNNTIAMLTAHIVRALRFQRRIRGRSILIEEFVRMFNVRYKACFISYMYLFTKWMYLVNIWCQFYFMNWFLRTNTNSWYGFDVVADIINGTPWEASGHFPRVSICDFNIRVVSNMSKYSVQCVLVINIFNEKIFVFFWLWYMILVVSTILSFIYWTIVILTSQIGMSFVKDSLELSDMELNTKDKATNKKIKNFVNDYLRQDGIFILRMISLHAGLITMTDLLVGLFKAYLGIETTEVAHPLPQHETAKQEAYLADRKKSAAEALRKRKHKELDDLTDLPLLHKAVEAATKDTQLGSDPSSKATSPISVVNETDTGSRKSKMSDASTKSI
uniref:Innexin n=1 Tax=Panagrellus redivivus TaxID=6233 RepID=A0A7E4URB4_PANRE